MSTVARFRRRQPDRDQACSAWIESPANCEGAVIEEKRTVGRTTTFPAGDEPHVGKSASASRQAELRLTSSDRAPGAPVPPSNHARRSRRSARGPAELLGVPEPRGLVSVGLDHRATRGDTDMGGPACGIQGDRLRGRRGGSVEGKHRQHRDQNCLPSMSTTPIFDDI